MSKKIIHCLILNLWFLNVTFEIQSKEFLLFFFLSLCVFIFRFQKRNLSQKFKVQLKKINCIITRACKSTSGKIWLKKSINCLWQLLQDSLVLQQVNNRPLKNLCKFCLKKNLLRKQILVFKVLLNCSHTILKRIR